MPNAQTKPDELSTAMLDSVSKSIVATVTTAQFQFRSARGQVNFVVRHQQFADFESVVIKNTSNRAAAKIHVTLRLDEPDVLTVHGDLADVRIEFLLKAKTAAVFVRQCIHKPETGVVQGSLVFVLGVTEASDYSD
jgi:hypothetical protein